MLKILITGVVGFIGADLAESLLNTDATIIGIDNMNDYYDVSLKEYRLSRLNTSNFTFIRGDISDSSFVQSVLVAYRHDIVVNLAAQAGGGIA